MKNIFIVLMIVSVMMYSVTSALAVSEDSAASSPALSQSQSTTVQPRINYQGSVYLSAKKWCNVTSSNNLFPDSPLVTSDANNITFVALRVINASGAQVGSTKSVNPGSSVRFDRIPAMSGTYTIQAYTNTAGYYYFHIT